MVVVDEKCCISCKMCALVCPFGAIKLSGTSVAGVAGIQVETPTFPKGTSDIIAWEIGVYAAAVKCDLCSFSKDGPACVNSCLTGSVQVIDKSHHKKLLNDKRIKASVELEAIAKDTSEGRNVLETRSVLQGGKTLDNKNSSEDRSNQ
jgi:hydrogenase-4 component A